jgi:hypothetical protein
MRIKYYQKIYGVPQEKSPWLAKQPHLNLPGTYESTPKLAF